jgi:hypothetical protein
MSGLGSVLPKLVLDYDKNHSHTAELYSQDSSLVDALGGSVAPVLRCAYSLGAFGGVGHEVPFLKICAEHSRVLPIDTSASETGPETGRKGRDLSSRLKPLRHTANSVWAFPGDKYYEYHARL